MIKILIVAFSFLNGPLEKDSLGIETINGKVYVVHKVGEKETLFAISKRYGSTVDAVLAANPGITGNLEIGQILKVPYTARITSTRTGGETIHKVAEKETLFSISKMYNVSIDDLKQWNGLTSNSLSLGQELIVKKKAPAKQAVVTNTVPAMVSKKGTHTVEAKETMFSIARQYGISVQQLRDWNSIEGNEISIGQVLFVIAPENGLSVSKDPSQQQPVKEVVKEQPVTTTQAVTTVKTPDSNTMTPPVEKEVKAPVKDQVISITESVKDSDEVLESGQAELIEGTDGNRKYLALHRTAPIGTILKVRNEMNNREVFVRVIGKLPDTALTDKIIIRISKSAYDRLGAIDQRFRVQVTYYK